jgi:hypothetical protein
MNDFAANYANLMQGRNIKAEASAERKHVSYNAETTKTVVLYLLNLVSMILMCILVVGILVITLIIWLEGSL